MGKYKTFGSLFNRVYRNDLNQNFVDIEADINAQKTRVDNLIAGTPQPSEVVDARGGKAVLKDRLDAVDTSFAESTSKIDDIFINVKKPPNGIAKAKGDGVTDDTSAIQAALNYKSYGTVYLPDGDYLISAPLTSNNSTSIQLSKGARIFTNTVMDDLIIFNSVNNTPGLDQLSRKVSISGGKLDGNNKVKNILTLSQYLGFFVKDMYINNFLEKGIITNKFMGSASAAELIVDGVHFRNSQANTGSIAIYNNGKDNYFHDIIVIDIETAVWTTDSMFDRIHHWISISGLLSNSCTLNVQDGYAMFSQIYSDTVRFPFKLASGKLTRINDSVVLYNTAVYTSALATTYPVTVFSGDATVQYYVKNNLIAAPFNVTMCEQVYDLGRITDNILSTANGAIIANQVDHSAKQQMKSKQSLLSNDLNNANTTGVYTISNPSSTFANFPTGAYAYGVLEVFQSFDQSVQRYTPLSGTTYYWRTGKTGSWQPWVKVTGVLA